LLLEEKTLKKALLFKAPYEKTEYKTSERERERKKLSRDANKEYYQQYRKEHYQKNKEAYKKRARERKKLYKEAWTEYKATLSCVQCGQNHPATFDFHHVQRSPSNRQINRLLACGAFRRAIEEVQTKCVVLCANCHRIHHHNERLEKKNKKGGNKTPLSNYAPSEPKIPRGSETPNE
jgi:hypothetical protein